MQKRQASQKYILICGTINYILSRTIKELHNIQLLQVRTRLRHLLVNSISQKNKKTGEADSARGGWNLMYLGDNIASMVQIPLIQLVKVQVMDVFVCTIRMLKNCMPRSLWIHLLLSLGPLQGRESGHFAIFQSAPRALWLCSFKIICRQPAFMTDHRTESMEKN